ncbi:MAG: transporter [Candidatus Riflebacteria bacterium]|jgi:hypothetical protein
MKRNTAIIAIAGLLMASAVYGQSAVLPPITMSGHGGAPQQMSLPPISRTQMAPATARNTALPSINQAPVVRSQSGAPQQAYRQPQQYQAKGAQLIQSRGNDVYSQQSINLPPVTTLPVPSRTALPPLYSDTLMTVPLDEAVTRVLGCNMLGFTGLTNTVSADVSKAGSFKMGFHSSWFDLERIYDRSLATNESGEKLELPLFFNYALTDDLEAVLNIPIIDYTAKSREIWTRDLSESGVGDMKLGFKYRVFDNAEYQMRGAFGVAFKFPTGSDDKMLGTGKTDFEIFTAFSKNFEKIVGHLNLGYIMTGDPNNQFYPDGLADKFYYNLGIEYPHTHNVTVMAEVAGEDWGSCGMKVEVIPGIRYAPTENFAFEVAVPICVTNDQQWGYNYRLVVGLTTFFQ